MLLINTTLQHTTLRMRDLAGNITFQLVNNRIFDVYDLKSLVLEAMTPKTRQLATLINTKKIFHPETMKLVPEILESIDLPTTLGMEQLPLLLAPIVVDNWSDLMRIHRDDNVYQLVPRRARSNAAYQLMNSICIASKSPFRMKQRIDTLDLKFVFRAADQELKQSFNAKSAEKVTSNICFDGILKGEKDSALVMAHASVTPAQINQLAGTVSFLKDWIQSPSDGDRHRLIKQSYKDILLATGKRVHLFCGSNTAVSKDLVGYAKSKSIHVYARRGGGGGLASALNAQSVLGHGMYVFQG